MTGSAQDVFNNRWSTRYYNEIGHVTDINGKCRIGIIISVCIGKGRWTERGKGDFDEGRGERGIKHKIFLMHDPYNCVINTTNYILYRHYIMLYIRMGSSVEYSDACQRNWLVAPCIEFLTVQYQTMDLLLFLKYFERFLKLSIRKSFRNELE